MSCPRLQLINSQHMTNRATSIGVEMRTVAIRAKAGQKEVVRGTAKDRGAEHFFLRPPARSQLHKCQPSEKLIAQQMRGALDCCTVCRNAQLFPQKYDDWQGLGIQRPIILQDRLGRSVAITTDISCTTGTTSDNVEMYPRHQSRIAELRPYSYHLFLP